MQIFLFRILENYLVRGSDRIFESYESFFQFADVDPYLRVSIGEWLVKHGLDNQFIEQYLVPFFRVIYEQSSEINGIIRSCFFLSRSRLTLYVTEKRASERNE
jgi:hypothetical protein